jgi:hypothetical protein
MLPESLHRPGHDDVRAVTELECPGLGLVVAIPGRTPIIGCHARAIGVIWFNRVNQKMEQV